MQRRFAAQGLRIGPGRVFRDVHHGQALPHREAHRLLRQPLQLLDRPILGVLADRARSNEGAALDREAGALGDVGDRHDVGLERPRGAVRLHPQLAVDDLPREALDVPHDVRPGARKSDVGGIDAQRIDQVQNANLLVDRRRPHRGRLQAVAQRLVIEHDGRRGRRPRRVHGVPVVDERMHGPTP
jgi:hypothetical protein